VDVHENDCELMTPIIQPLLWVVKREFSTLAARVSHHPREFGVHTAHTLPMGADACVIWGLFSALRTYPKRQLPLDKAGGL
jgi:hypothetical protein